MIASRSIFFTIAILQPLQCFPQRDGEMLSYHEFPFFNDEKSAAQLKWHPATSQVHPQKWPGLGLKKVEIYLKIFVSDGRVVCVKKKTKNTKKDQLLLLILYQFRTFHNQIGV